MYAQIAFNTLTSKSSLARPNFSTSEKIILVDCSVLLIIVVQTLQFDKHKTNDVLFLYVGREICKNKEMAWRHFDYSCYPYNAKPISCQRLPEKGQGTLKMKSVSFYKTLLKDKPFKLCLWMSKIPDFRVQDFSLTKFSTGNTTSDAISQPERDLR